MEFTGLLDGSLRCVGTLDALGNLVNIFLIIFDFISEFVGDWFRFGAFFILYFQVFAACSAPTEKLKTALRS